MAGIPLDTAVLLAIFLETFLYGIFFTLFWITLCILLKNRTKTKPNHFLISALIFMLILTTSHIVIDSVRIIEGFIDNWNSAQGGPAVYYTRLTDPLFVWKNVLYTTLSITGDIVLAWRCYVVCHKNRLVVIIPVVLLAAGAFCGYAACWSISTASPGSTIFAAHTKKWLTSFFVITLCTNTYCTALIVSRIWTSIRSLGPRHNGTRYLILVLMALVESGALYACALLMVLATYLSDSNGQYVALDVVTPTIGIVFTLIIIQINAYASEMSGSYTLTAASWRTGQASTQVPAGSYPMQSMDINTTTHQALHIDRAQLHTDASRKPSNKQGSGED